MENTTTIPATVSIVIWNCPQEGCDGEMERCGGSVLDMVPPEYPHACNKCGHFAHSEKCFPRTVFERIA